MIVMTCTQGLDPFNKSQSKITKYYLPAEIKTIEQAMYWFDDEIAIKLINAGIMETSFMDLYYKPITVDGKEYDYEYLFEFHEMKHGSRRIKYISQFYEDLALPKSDSI